MISIYREFPVRQSHPLMTTVNFYHDLPALESFAQAIETARHAQVQPLFFLQEDSAARCLQVGVGEEVRLC